MPSEYEEQREFEAEVRRVAEAIWHLQPGACQPVHYSADPTIHELDGMARLRDVTHLLMATVSRRLDKAKADIRKLNAAQRIEGRDGTPTGQWLITKYQLEAEHHKLARQSNVRALTLDQFRRRFFDGREYLAKRRVAAFGSARNLQDGSVSFPDNEYIDLPMTEIGSESQVTGRQGFETVRDFASALRDSQTVIVIAPFGSGKSLTAREVFQELAADHLKSDGGPVPIAINLREHWGSVYADEILVRHARSIGFSSPDDLVAAWRAGITLLIIDGFDELASQVVAAAGYVRFMREARFQALQGPRDLISKAPGGVGIFICGRDHYFDDESEMVHALGLGNRPYRVVRLLEFTEEQAQTFLKRHGVDLPLPDWLPRKPLILGYLAHRGLLDAIVRISATEGFGHAWDSFLTLICQREATHDRAVMDASTLRHVLERLACNVRATSSGAGPITGIELAEVYRQETGQAAGEGVIMQLQRLPGLTAREQDPTARSFIDEDFLAALQGSAIARFVLENAVLPAGARWIHPLSSRGIAMASYLFTKAGAEPATVLAVGGRLHNRGVQTEPQLAADCLMIALEMARESAHLDCHGFALREASLGTVDLEDMKIENLLVQDCTVNEVVLGADLKGSTVRFVGNAVGKVSGVPSKEGLPQGMFENCEIERFDDMSTNAAIMRSNQPASLKALFSILRKLYLQAGGGRKLGALKRGVPPGPVLDSVDEVLEILKSEGLLAIFHNVAHPIRRQAGRVKLILGSASLSDDSVVRRVRELG